MKKLIIGLMALVVASSASPISVGIHLKQNTKASGTLLRNIFRKCDTTVGVGTVAFHSRFTEGASLKKDQNKSFLLLE